MTQYRFHMKGRHGKWYDRLSDAQQFANSIGAGFLDPKGRFTPCRGAILEMREKEDRTSAQAAPQAPPE